MPVKSQIPNELQKLEKLKSIPLRIVEQIGYSVAAGRFRPGQKLPSEAELAEIFGVGRSSVREALQALQLLGILEVVHGKGSFLKGKAAEVFPLSVSWAGFPQRQVALQLMEVREIVEPSAIDIAIERVTPVDIDQMRATLAAAEESIADPSKYIDLAVSFHGQLIDSAHNDVLSAMFRAIERLYSDVAGSIERTPELSRQYLAQHEQIFKAVAANDARQAKRLLRQHLRDVKRAYGEQIPRETGKAGENRDGE